MFNIRQYPLVTGAILYGRCVIVAV